MMRPTQNPENQKYLSCCGTYHVQKGATYIGYFQLIIILLLIIATIALVAFEKEDIAGAIFGIHSDEILKTEDYRYRIIIPGVISIAIIIQVIAIILLIFGAITQNRYLLLPFLVTTGLTIASLILRFFGSMMLDTQTAVTAMISTSIALLVQIWFFFIVLRCFQYLAEMHRNTQAHPQQYVLAKY